MGKRIGLDQAVIVLAFLTIAMVSVSACLGSGDKAPGMYNAPIIPNTTQPTDQAAYIVSQQRGNTSSGDVSVSGIVKSNMRSPLTAWVNVELKDKNNMIVGTGEAIIRLDMQGVSDFEVVIPDSAKYAHDQGTTYRCYVNRITY